MLDFGKSLLITGGGYTMGTYIWQDVLPAFRLAILAMRLSKELQEVRDMQFKRLGWLRGAKAKKTDTTQRLKRCYWTIMIATNDIYHNYRMLVANMQSITTTSPLACMKIEFRRRASSAIAGLRTMPVPCCSMAYF